MVRSSGQCGRKLPSSSLVPAFMLLNKSGRERPFFYSSSNHRFTRARFPSFTMKKRNAWSALPGSTPAEKLQVLGVEKNTRMDIRRLDEISRRYGITVYLFFEEVLARNRPLETVIQEFGSVPVFERPFISVPDFLRFTKENDPSFEQTLREFPLRVEIVSSGNTLAG